MKEADKALAAGKDAITKADDADKVSTAVLIIEDKTLTDDQRKEQLLGVDTEYAKGIENIDAARSYVSSFRYGAL